MSIAEVADLLACPRCQGRLSLDDRSLRCSEGHTFDLAKQGYANLLQGAQPQHADTAEMVQARVDFLATGAYTPIADAVGGRLDGVRSLLDVGAGTGWYASRWLDALPQARAVAADISTFASRRAAKAHPRLGAVVADTWAGLPIRSGVMDAVTCVFAPRNVAEFARVLRPGGVLLVVTPTVDHLHEARTALGLLDVEPDKGAKLQRQVSGLLDPVGQTMVRRAMELAPEHLTALVDMGPNAFHRHADPREGDVAAPPLTVTASVQVSWFRKPTG